jgi:hypothetical protein
VTGAPGACGGAELRQAGEPADGGLDALVGRGQRDAHVPGARGPVKVARSDQNAQLG